MPLREQIERLLREPLGSSLQMTGLFLKNLSTRSIAVKCVLQRNKQTVAGK